MGIFARAVISGFGFTLGAALFKRVSKQLGLDDGDKTEAPAHPVEASADEDGDT